DPQAAEIRPAKDVLQRVAGRTPVHHRGQLGGGGGRGQEEGRLVLGGEKPRGAEAGGDGGFGQGWGVGRRRRQGGRGSGGADGVRGRRGPCTCTGPPTLNVRTSINADPGGTTGACRGANSPRTRPGCRALITVTWTPSGTCRCNCPPSSVAWMTVCAPWSSAWR